MPRPITGIAYKNPGIIRKLRVKRDFLQPPLSPHMDPLTNVEKDPLNSMTNMVDKALMGSDIPLILIRLYRYQLHGLGNRKGPEDRKQGNSSRRRCGQGGETTALGTLQMSLGARRLGSDRCSLQDEKT